MRTGCTGSVSQQEGGGGGFLNVRDLPSLFEKSTVDFGNPGGGWRKIVSRGVFRGGGWRQTLRGWGWICRSVTEVYLTQGGGCHKQKEGILTGEKFIQYFSNPFPNILLYGTYYHTKYDTDYGPEV